MLKKIALISMAFFIVSPVFSSTREQKDKFFDAIMQSDDMAVKETITEKFVDVNPCQLKQSNLQMFEIFIMKNVINYRNICQIYSENKFN